MVMQRIVRNTDISLPWFRLSWYSFLDIDIWFVILQKAHLDPVTESLPEELNELVNKMETKQQEIISCVNKLKQ